MIIKFNKILTIKELKKYLNNIPEIDANGDDFTIWIQSDDPGCSRPVYSIAPLNCTPSGSDILLGDDIDNFFSDNRDPGC